MRKPFRLALLALTVLWAMSAQLSARTYLVSVGISAYPGTENDLIRPADDARRMVWLFTKNGDVEYRQLLDAEATKQAVVQAMHTLFSKAEEDDVVVFYFSGHGQPGCFNTYGSKLTYAEVAAAMATARCQRKIIFADACFAGQLRGSRRSRALESAVRKADVLLFLSSRSGETSLDSHTLANSLFTAHLERGLRGGADADRDRTITARELFDFVSPRVVKDSGGKQHPVMWGKFPSDMPIMTW